MKKTGGIMQRVIRAAIIVTLIIYFGATAHARNAKNYVMLRKSHIIVFLSTDGRGGSHAERQS